MTTAAGGDLRPTAPGVLSRREDTTPRLPPDGLRVFVNLDRQGEPPPAVRDAYAFHRRLPAYQPSPLRALGSLAAELGVESVWIKDESSRFGLPAFKILGVSWAAYRAVLARLGISGDPGWDLAQLASAVGSVGAVRLVAPTDGNHGHAVASVARLLGVPARIYVPSGTVTARIRAIQLEGASVEVVRGGFDDAVAAASAAAVADRDALLLADTSTGIYDEVAEWVIEGYQTIGWELAEQLPSPPHVVLVPIGVGGLAAAIGRTLTPHRDGTRRPMLVGIEPHEAACMMASVAAGRILTLPGATDSIMAGLSCGTPSSIAWPTVRATYDLFASIGAETARLGMRELKQLGLAGGECSGGVLGALLQLAGRTPGLLQLTPDATVVLIATEGVTDPDNYEALVAMP